MSAYNADILLCDSLADDYTKTSIATKEADRAEVKFRVVADGCRERPQRKRRHERHHGYLSCFPYCIAVSAFYNNFYLKT